jgi:predicted nucleic acid-binding protein
VILLDTNVLSAVRKPGRHPQVKAWIAAQREQELFLSAITVGELERGLELQRRRDPGSASQLESWIRGVLAPFFDRIIPFGHDEARVWGLLSARTGNSGTDNQIAATALVHDAVLATRNVRHFASSGVSLVNPYDFDLD